MANDNRIPEDLEKRILKPGDTFRFRCTQCGKCCKNREDIIVSPFDLFRIARHFPIKPIEAVKRYCRAYIGQSSHIPVLTLKAQGHERACVFLKDNLCSIHHAKPTVCALFPLGRAAAVERDDKGTDLPQGVFYFLQPIECGAKDETHTIREWLGEYDLESSDEWFGLWQQTIVALYPLITRIERSLSGNPLEAVHNMLLSLLYLEYADDAEFMPQFTANAAKLQNILRDLISMADKFGR